MFIYSSDSDDDDDDIEFDVDDDAYMRYLNALDPGKWKKQDHYKVLGLSQLRYRATEAHIRKACMFEELCTFCHKLSMAF